MEKDIFSRLITHTSLLITVVIKNLGIEDYAYPKDFFFLQLKFKICALIINSMYQRFIFDTGITDHYHMVIEFPGSCLRVCVKVSRVHILMTPFSNHCCLERGLGGSISNVFSQRKADFLTPGILEFDRGSKYLQGNIL